MARQISSERKAAYYVGMIIAILGVLSFLSVFLSGAAHFGDFSNFEARGRSMATRAVLGIVMIAVGTFVMSVGARGAAGSGVILDPEQAREDVEPWSRMTGGVIKDALDEADIHLGGDRADHDDHNLPFDERLRRLHKLREDGLITEQEYLAAKARILAEV